MNTVSFRHVIRDVLGYSFRIIPTNLLQKWSQPQSSRTLRRLARLGIRNRDVIIEQGVGAGLRFNSGTSNPDYALGVNELSVQQALVDCLKPGDIFYDIGAHVGFFTAITARQVGSQGKVYAFEPDPQNATRLQANMQLNHFQNVTLFQKAVSNYGGQGELLLAEYPGGHTLATAGTPPDLKGAITVELVCIDDLVTQHILEPPSVVKIDVEGAELEVLQGMAATIQQYHPIILYEVDDATPQKLAEKRTPIQNFLQGYGYQIQPLKDCYAGGGWQVENAIALPKV
ncbi:FkbM family methyltransferase [Lyngbya sp. PCC 8106]|uniref:FkbM family methyltransferase n=1 Tax=Lyngbya sp. (strain PCC 8106) TaxID=313612 RepID=UPI0000EA8FAA|nr:FkbM family methyltransferase [Lyngbya sp. PCC 8106]EAW36173.1 putative methyltransferase-like protein [Lyngbya sp. PCC 8106]